MQELHLVSPIPPSVNHYLGYRGVLKGGKPVAMSYCTNEAKKYKQQFADYVRKEVVKQGWDLVPNRTQHFYVDTVFYFPATNLDCNNYFKCMLDAITDTQLIWLDDNITCERVQAIYYDADNPRVEIVIHPVDYIGVFDNASHLEAFVAKCTDCVRYTRNCSLLNKAREGRIQGDIVDGICKKYKQRKGIKGGNRNG